MEFYSKGQKCTKFLFFGIFSFFFTSWKCFLFYNYFADGQITVLKFIDFKLNSKNNIFTWNFYHERRINNFQNSLFAKLAISTFNELLNKYFSIYQTKENNVNFSKSTKSIVIIFEHQKIISFSTIYVIFS